ncbi:MAG: ABC-type antimicrobial peptide transport system, permease component [Solidesulfovibrio magneticus str. Maddingley MBC34]|uniref:ABC-type antimicrobial peptide transport system, permease component n=1 Tax=Solidesulfovibrio magneticus str. Maddingley MBC34 TaxID=1206767 RepID=K6FRA6_9BACT|nr:MAG: ABC-type antimicrobial peptide transport system, permease component [Solidesulfovibrio magneticus str. Maddingley MBC34]
MAIGKRKKITVAELDRIRRRGAGPMRYYDLVRVSVREVMRKRRRYIGVLASIALGMAGFIVIITMGNDLKKNFNNDLDLLGGATIINVMFEPQNLERQEWFRDRTLEAIARIPGVLDITTVALKTSAVTTWHDRLFGFNLVGCEANYWKVFSFNAKAGRLFDQRDVDEGARVCVVGADLARQIFGSEDAGIGQTLSIDDNLYTVVGILGGVRAGDRALFVFLPITTAKARVVGISQPYSAYVRCATWDDVGSVSKAVPGVVKANQIDRGLRVNVAWEPLKQVQRIFWWVELFIYSSIVATMILGGFGIWNIMMATVTSRTREIGLKKAMGALDSDILYQFLFEALCVTLSSSVFGVILGRVGIEYMSRMLGSRPPEGLFVFCLLMGLGFAAILGVGAGLYPSIRASRMQVVDAMRYE